MRLERLHVVLHLGSPMLLIAFVNGVDLIFVGNLDVGLTQQKLSNLGIKRIDVNFLAHGQNKLGGGPIKAIAGRDLVLAVLEQLLLRGDLVLSRSSFVNSEDGPYGSVGVYVTRTVQRVEHNHVLSFWALLTNDRLFVLLAR